MPVTTERARRFMGAELARKRAGKRTLTTMSEEQLREMLRGTHKMKLKPKRK